VKTPIYKILTGEQWADLQANKESPGAPIDVADGFIHFSTAGQLQETADKHFAEQDGLYVLAVDADALGEPLKWEVSRGGALFPHLYAHLRLDDVHWAEAMFLVAGVHQLPKRVRQS